MSKKSLRNNPWRLEPSSDGGLVYYRTYSKKCRARVIAYGLNSWDRAYYTIYVWGRPYLSKWTRDAWGAKSAATLVVRRRNLA